MPRMPRTRTRAVVVAIVLGLAVPLSAPTGWLTSAEAKPPRTKGAVVWDATTYGPGGVVTAHGTVPARGRQRVLMQVKIPGGWRTFGRTRSTGKGAFGLSASLDWYGVHTVRVGSRGFYRKQSVQGVLDYAPLGTPGDFRYFATSGKPPLTVTPDPCRTLRYVVNVDDVGPVGLQLVQDAMARASYATGITTRFVGTTSAVPYDTRYDAKLPHRAELLIGWGTGAEIPELPAAGAVGLTQARRTSYARNGRGKKVLTARVTHVGLSTDYWNTAGPEHADTGIQRPWGAIIQHELGHVFGLDHVTGSGELMGPLTAYPDGLFYPRYGAGDLDGLQRTGLGGGCHR